QAMTRVRAQVNEETNKGQMPWGHTNLTGSVYLNLAALPASAKSDSTRSDSTKSDDGKADASASNTPAVTQASDMELEFWRSVKDTNKVEELNAYLANYPNGIFKAIALARIAKLESGGAEATRNLTLDASTVNDEADQMSEDKIGLDRGQRRDAQ